MMDLAIIVADSGPLITLAVADSLDLLLLPRLPVIVPDMVRHEVIQDLSKPGAALVAEWIRKHSQSIRIAPTEVYEEYTLLRSVNPATKSKNRGERAAAEVLEQELEEQDFGAVLIYEDSAVRKTNFLIRLPDNVVVTSTSEYLNGLQERRLIESAQAILDRAVDVRGNDILARHLSTTESGEPDNNWSKRMRPHRK